MNLRLLIIEDDEKVIENWKEKLEFNEIDDERLFNILPIYCRNLTEAKDTIDSKLFDAAVIDIRLVSEEGTPNSDGNEIFRRITESTLAVTAVYTGEPQAVDLGDKYKDFTMIFTKGDEDGDIDHILSWIGSKKSMILSVKKMRRSIDQEMAKLFSRSIWPRWSHWSEQASLEGGDFTDTSLKRHMATHLHASFLSEGDTHPEEYFFIPPLRDEADTGDIFNLSDGFFILVTPRCDLARDESHDTLQIISLEDISTEFEKLELNIKIAKEKGEQGKNARNNLRKLIQHKNNKSSCHFIPRIRLNDGEVHGPFFARFDELRSIEKNSLEASELKNSRIASLSNEFVPSLVERLGNFFSRIGTPDYSHLE